MDSPNPSATQQKYESANENKMPQNNKKLIYVAIIIGALFVMLIVGLVFGLILSNLGKNSNNNNSSTNLPQSNPITNTVSQTVTQAPPVAAPQPLAPTLPPAAKPTVPMSIYAMSHCGIKFNYPTGWKISPESLGFGNNYAATISFTSGKLAYEMQVGCNPDESSINSDKQLNAAPAGDFTDIVIGNTTVSETTYYYDAPKMFSPILTVLTDKLSASDKVPSVKYTSSSNGPTGSNYWYSPTSAFTALGKRLSVAYFYSAAGPTNPENGGAINLSGSDITQLKANIAQIDATVASFTLR